MCGRSARAEKGSRKWEGQGEGAGAAGGSSADVPPAPLSSGAAVEGGGWVWLCSFHSMFSCGAHCWVCC